MTVNGVLETALYAEDLAAAEQFYTRVLGMTVFSHRAGRHVFFRCGRGMLLVFNPTATQTQDPAVEAPLHGARGPGHVAFNVPQETLDDWRRKLEARGIPIEREIVWPEGGRSLYFRDPAGNSVELTSPSIWGIQ